MNQKTDEALEACIDKYERAAVAADEVFRSGKLRFTGWRCDLCGLFACSGSGCSGCPVMERTKLPGCESTPWDGGIPDDVAERLPVGYSRADDLDDVAMLVHLYHDEWSDEEVHLLCDHIRDRCRQEAEFLKSLRKPTNDN